MAIVGKAFRKCLPEDKNSCVNCDNYLTCLLAVDGSKGSWVCDSWWRMVLGCYRGLHGLDAVQVQMF